MDVTWALLCMKLVKACLMKSGISPGNMQQGFSWGAYQSILNPAVLRLLKIGYCPMIKGCGTDFATVYTVLKHAQIVGDVWNQRRLDSSLGESGRISGPIRLRHFPHACTKLVSTKIYIPLINIDFFRIFKQFFLEISLYASFRTVNHPLERFLER